MYINQHHAFNNDCSVTCCANIMLWLVGSCVDCSTCVAFICIKQPISIMVFNTDHDSLWNILHIFSTDSETEVDRDKSTVRLDIHLIPKKVLINIAGFISVYSKCCQPTRV